MECPNCGTKLPDGMVYCPKCGEEVQVISAVDALEDDILRELVDDSNNTDGEGNDFPLPGNGTAGAAREKKKTNKKHKRRNRILIIVIIVACAAVIAWISYRRTQTPERLFARAQEKYEQMDYEKAASLLERLLSEDEDDLPAILLAGRCYAAMQDYSSAETMFQYALLLDPDNVDAYAGLIGVYDSLGRRDEILALRETVSDAAILALFDDYLTPEPVIETPGGTYNDYFTLEISAPGQDMTIYYTLDGTVPTKGSLQYVSPITVNTEGSFTLTAVCMDADGYYSEPVSETYLLEFIAPDQPLAIPDGGEFTDQEMITVIVPAGTTVYYSWDNSTPDENSSRYTEPIEMPEGNHILSLIAVDSRGISSSVQRYNYIYYPPAASQTISNTSSGSSQTTQSEEDTSDTTDTQPVAQEPEEASPTVTGGDTGDEEEPDAGNEGQDGENEEPNGPDNE